MHATRRLGTLALVLALAAFAAAPVAAGVPADALYGSGLDAIVAIDPADGSLTPLAPQPARLLGLAFDSSGRLFATGCTDPASCGYLSEKLLLELDPGTGAILDAIGPITDLAGSRPAILALAVQPGTDVLYGFGHLGALGTRIWTIDPATALATPIATEVPAGCEPPACSSDLGFEFAADGTLLHGVLLSPGPGGRLLTLDPATGAELGSVFVGTWRRRFLSLGPALALRSDGTLFAMFVYLVDRPCQGCPVASSVLSTVDPLTGASSEVGRDLEYGGLDLAFSPVVVTPVDVDVAPGSERNAIELRSRGLVRVALLGSPDFDPAEVDVASLAFGPAGAPPFHGRGRLQDVNHDGLADLVASYRASETGIAPGDTRACLEGECRDGTPFAGCDSITTRPPGGAASERAR